MTEQFGQLPSGDSEKEVQAFCQLFNLTEKPIFLKYQDFGYGQNWCHVSAKHHALTHGGRRVHGWALWKFDGMVMGDFHSVWDAEGKFVEVTPPKFGSDQILFVPDRTAEIYKHDQVFVLPTNRSSQLAAPYWWLGKTTNETVWGLPASNFSFVEYCQTLGFSADSIVTEPGHG